MPMCARSANRSRWGMVVISCPKMRIDAGVGHQQAVGELQQHRLAAAGGAEQDQRLPALHGKGDVLEHRFGLEADGDVAEFDDRSRIVLRVEGCGAGAGDGFAHGRPQLPKMPIMARVTSRSTMMMKTEEMTTAWVVARPTPWVPPVVFMPK